MGAEKTGAVFSKTLFAMMNKEQIIYHALKLSDKELGEVIDLLVAHHYSRMIENNK